MRLDAGMGFVWIPWAVGAGGLAVGAAAAPVWRWVSDTGGLVLQTIGLTSDPKLNPTNPNFLPPAAPQTGSAMVNWSTDWLEEAERQRRAQNRLDDGAAAVSPPASKQDDYGGLLLLGAAGIGLLLVITAVKK